MPLKEARIIELRRDTVSIGSNLDLRDSVHQIRTPDPPTSGATNAKTLPNPELVQMVGLRPPTAQFNVGLSPFGAACLAT